MSIPSITIRIDFGDSGVTGSSIQQGVAPTPMNISGLAGAAHGSAPTPTLDPTGGTAQSALPAPGAGILDFGAAAGGPPAPSPDIPGLQQGVASDDAMPQPEGDPEKKPPRRK